MLSASFQAINDNGVFKVMTSLRASYGHFQAPDCSANIASNTTQSATAALSGQQGTNIDVTITKKSIDFRI